LLLLRRILDGLCAALAALALFAIMALTLIDVGGRKLLSNSVPGSLELTELLMVVVIFAGLPLVSLRGEHVVFDSLDAVLPPAVRAVQRFVVELFCCAALAGVAWLLAVKAGQMVEYGDKTAQLGIPQGPFVFLMSALVFVTAVVHLMLIVRPVSHHHPGVGQEPNT